MHNANKIPYTSDLYRPIWQYADERGLPVLLHTWGALDRHEPVLKEYGNTSILLAHSGCTRADEYIRCAERHPHVYLDLAFSGCYGGLVEYFVEHVSAERVVFGSDMPWMPLGQQIGKVVFADISDEQKRAILRDNARRILKVDGAA
jgi:predicted TIM-barrel fold metal-dependent hydrolase